MIFLNKNILISVYSDSVSYHSAIFSSSSNVNKILLKISDPSGKGTNFRPIRFCPTVLLRILFSIFINMMSSSRDQRLYFAGWLVDGLNLNFLNDGSFTRIAVRLCIVLSFWFCSNALSFISLWKIINHPYGSDHLPILIEIVCSNCGSTCNESFIPDLYKTVNWENISELILFFIY